MARASWLHLARGDGGDGGAGRPGGRSRGHIQRGAAPRPGRAGGAGGRGRARWLRAVVAGKPDGNPAGFAVGHSRGRRGRHADGGAGQGTGHVSGRRHAAGDGVGRLGNTSRPGRTLCHLAALLCRGFAGGDAGQLGGKGKTRADALAREPSGGQLARLRPGGRRMADRVGGDRAASALPRVGLPVRGGQRGPADGCLDSRPANQPGG